MRLDKHNSHIQFSSKQRYLNKSSFIIFSVPRSGSTNLCRRLDQHTNICCGEEIVTSYRRCSNTYKKNIIHTFLNTITSVNRKGFKLFPEHMNFNVLNKEFLNHCYIIYLRRYDIFNMVVSYLYAKRTRIWETISEYKSVHLIPITINTHKFHRAVQKYFNWIRHIHQRLLNIDHYQIDYRQSFKDISKLLQYLQVDSKQKLPNPLQKIYHKRSYESLIANYDQLEKLWIPYASSKAYLELMK